MYISSTFSVFEAAVSAQEWLTEKDVGRRWRKRAASAKPAVRRGAPTHHSSHLLASVIAQDYRSSA